MAAVSGVVEMKVQYSNDRYDDNDDGDDRGEGVERGGDDGDVCDANKVCKCLILEIIIMILMEKNSLDECYIDNDSEEMVLLVDNDDIFGVSEVFYPPAAVVAGRSDNS